MSGEKKDEKKREGLSLADWQLQVNSDVLDHADCEVAIAMVLTADKGMGRHWLTTITTMNPLDYATAAGIMIRSAIDQLDDDKRLNTADREVVAAALRRALFHLPVAKPELRDEDARTH